MKTVWYAIGGAIALVALLGAAFTFGMKWNGSPQTQAAAAGATTEEETASSTEATDEEITEDERELFDVAKIIDGDTITIKIGDNNETVRLIGIDTPETVDTRVDIQCFGKESSNKLKSLLTGHKVYYEIDEGEGERDKYKRLLAYIFRDDGLHINKYMIEEGYAYEYTYDTDYKYQDEFKDAEKSAKAAQKGLWKPNVCPTPAVKGTTTTAPKKVEPVAPPPVSTSTPQPAPEPAEESQSKEEPKEEPAKEPEPEPAPTGNYTCSSNKYNCTDFKTRSEAQAVYDQCGGAANDIHKLDSNKDGEACESLP